MLSVPSSSACSSAILTPASAGSAMVHGPSRKPVQSRFSLPTLRDDPPRPAESTCLEGSTSSIRPQTLSRLTAPQIVRHALNAASRWPRRIAGT